MNNTESTATLLCSQCCQLEFYIKEVCCEYDQEGHLRAVPAFILSLLESGEVCKEKDKDRQSSSLKQVVYLPKYLAPRCFL